MKVCNLQHNEVVVNSCLSRFHMTIKLGYSKQISVFILLDQFYWSGIVEFL